MVSVVAVASVLGTSAPARADDVESAQRRVAQLQGLQEQTTARLLAGTRRWEADRQRLRSTQVALRNTQRRIDRVQRDLRQQQSQISAVVRSLYQNPTPTAVQLAVTRGPDEVLQALQSLQALDKAAGSQAAVLQRATALRHRLRASERQARLLQSEAASLAEGSRRRMDELQALAASTGDELASAQSALSRARAARDAARARAAAAARAARSRSSGGGALCSGRSSAGQGNGNLDPASLCPLWGAPGHRLVSDAAAAFNRMSRAYARDRGGPLCVTDSYRSYSEQVSVYRRKPGLAAVPGTSEHGWGQGGRPVRRRRDSGSRAHQWLQANSRRFGWFHPSWAEPGGSRPEPWHWEYGG